MSFTRRGNEQFEPRLYNNKINAAGFKSTCQSLGPQSGGSTHSGKETYGVRDVSESDGRLFSGSYAPVGVSKLNQCGAGKKKKAASKKKKSSTKKKTASKKKKSSTKKKTASKKKKSSTKKKKSSTKKRKSSTKKRKSSTKKRGLISKFRKAFGMKGGALESYTAGYTPKFSGIAPNNSSLANPQSISRINSCQAPHSYNHYTGVSK